MLGYYGDTLCEVNPKDLKSILEEELRYVIVLQTEISDIIASKKFTSNQKLVLIEGKRWMSESILHLLLSEVRESKNVEQPEQTVTNQKL